MIILAQPYCNNSNILFQNLHLDAFCRSNNLEFINPHLKPYGAIFPNLEKWNYFADTKHANFLKFKSLIAKNFDGSRPPEVDRQWLLARKNLTTWVKGWYFRSHKDVVEHRDYYKSLFTPVCDADIRREIDTLKMKGKVLSVHIRRGDYRRWQGGKYYFEDSVYLESINKALDTSSDIKTIMLFSNEPIEIDRYKSLGVEVVYSQGAWHEDQWKMAQSDLILGPPSTFSAWASFVGSVPIWHVETLTSKVNFQVSNG